jgi:hypothetical protein
VYCRIRANGMKSYLKLGVVICVIALSASAFAGSVSNLDDPSDLRLLPNANLENFNYSAKLSGVTGTTLDASFTYNKKTDTFTSETLTFVGGIFNGVSVTITKAQHGDEFTFDKKVDGDTIAYTIIFNPQTGTYDAYGTITKGRNVGSFQHDTMAPEGGTQLSYLAASGLVLLAGILLAGKRRRLAENCQ